MDFRKEIPILDDRKEESTKILKTHPGKTPVIMEPKNSAHILQQSRFLVPKNYTFHEFMFHVRKRMQIGPMNSLYITTGNQIPSIDKTIGKIYEDYKDLDGFLYVKYSSESVLG